MKKTLFILSLLLSAKAFAQQPNQPELTWNPSAVPAATNAPSPMNTAPPTGDTNVNGILAKVNEKIITQADVDRARPELEKSEKKSLTQKEILETLINDTILDTELIRERIDITNEELAEAMQSVAFQQKMGMQELKSTLMAKGITQDAFENGLRSDLQKNKFLQRVIFPRVKIADAEIDAYYQSHSQDFKGFGAFRFLEILLTPESAPQGQDVKDVAATIVQELKKGTDFSVLARRYSQGAFASKGGDSGLLSATEIRPNLLQLLNNLSINDPSPPMATPNGIMMIKVLEKKDPRIQPLAEAKERVKQKVFEVRSREELNKYLTEVRQKHFVQIMAP